MPDYPAGRISSESLICYMSSLYFLPLEFKVFYSTLSVVPVQSCRTEGPLLRSAGLTDAVVYGVQIPGCEGRIGMAAIAEDIGNCTIHNLEQLLMTCGYSYVQISGGDPNTLNLDPDPGLFGTIWIRNLIQGCV